jgi:Zn-finger nucleic acid-binding protein
MVETVNRVILCPGDGQAMRSVTIESHYTRPIVLEQCVECGGIWFDESELFRAKQGEAVKLECLDGRSLRSTTYIEKPVLHCPRDGSGLYRFEDRYFPDGIILERCRECNGIWLNRGDFGRFQAARSKLQHRQNQPVTSEATEVAIKQILDSYDKGSNTDILQRIGAFLSTPLDRNTLRPSTAEDNSGPVGNEAEMAISVLMLIFRLLVFRF